MAQLRILPVRSDKILEATVMAAVHVVLGRDGVKVCVLGQDGRAICSIICPMVPPPITSTFMPG